MRHLRFFYLNRGLLASPPLLLALFLTYRQAENGWLVWTIGLLIFFLGLFGRIWAQQHLHYRLKMPMTLTRTGPYALIRNPIYVFNILTSVGLTVVSRVLWMVPITILWSAVIFSIVVREEEQRISKVFGPPYLAYLKEVPRWIPRGSKVPLELVNEHLAPSIRAELYNLLYLIPFVIKEVDDQPTNRPAIGLCFSSALCLRFSAAGVSESVDRFQTYGHACGPGSHLCRVSMREHLKFIASDELQGRNTPSPGLDRAAEYIAAQFKKAGLEAVGDDGYFQTANWVQPARNPKTFSLSIQSGGQTVSADPAQVTFSFPGALSLRGVPLVKIDFANTASHAELKASDVEGKAVITELPDLQRADRARRGELMQAQTAFVSRLRSLKAAMVLSIDRNGVAGTGFNPGRLIDPDNRPPQGWRSRVNRQRRCQSCSYLGPAAHSVRCSSAGCHQRHAFDQCRCSDRGARQDAKCHRAIARLGSGSTRNLCARNRAL